MAREHHLTSLSVSNLNKAELAQFVTRFLDDLAKSGLSTANDDIITKLLAELRKQLPALQKALVQVQASDKTKSLIQADKDRDNDLKALRAGLKAHRTAKKEATKAAYTSLSLLFDSVKTAERASYEEETALINGFLAKLAVEPYLAQVRTLGLQAFVDNLAESNAAFNTLFASRSKDDLSKVSYDSKALKQALIDPYQDLANYILVLARVKGDKASKDLLKVVNNSRQYYADHTSRR